MGTANQQGNNRGTLGQIELFPRTELKLVPISRSVIFDPISVLSRSLLYISRHLRAHCTRPTPHKNKVFVYLVVYYLDR